MSSPPVAPAAHLIQDLRHGVTPPSVDQAGLLISTSEGRVTANPGWHLLTRRVLPPGTRDGWLTAVHPDDRASAMRALRSFDAGQVSGCDVRLISGDGSIAATARLEVHRPPGWPPGTNVIAVVPHSSEVSAPAEGGS